MTRRLIIDTHNLLFRVAAMNAKQVFTTDEERAGLALHTSLMSVNKYYKKFKPDQLVFVFEGSNNWRKEYTKSDRCLTPKVYKANRVRDPSMEPFFALVKSFYEVMHQFTTAICIMVDSCEGDDIVAALCQNHNEDEDGIIENIVISTDKDYVQLLQHEGVRLIDPDTGNDRTCDDIDYFIFEKCIRGDTGDNVHSAYPRVRSTKIQEAYTDPFKLQNMMETEWQGKIQDDGTQKTYRVADFFKENQLLMDLSCQPEHIREELDMVVDIAMKLEKKYSNFHFMKFLGAHGLEAIAETIHLYTDMLSAKPKIGQRKKVEVSKKSAINNSATAVDDLIHF
jgi:hypothetical protein